MVFHQFLILRTLLHLKVMQMMWVIVHRKRTCQLSRLKSRLYSHRTAPQDEVAFIIDHQFVSTRCMGYYKFLVKWKHRSTSDSAWVSKVLSFNDCIQTYLLHILIVTCPSQVLQERQQLMKIRRQRKVTCNPRSLGQRKCAG